MPFLFYQQTVPSRSKLRILESDITTLFQIVQAQKIVYTEITKLKI